MVQHPMRQYLPYQKWSDVIDADGVVSRTLRGTFKQRKPRLPKGNAVKVCRVLEDKCLDQMLFGQPMELE